VEDETAVCLFKHFCPLHLAKRNQGSSRARGMS
jgi:hypothetical protein